MPLMYGPSWPRRQSDPKRPDMNLPDDAPPFFSHARTLGDAIRDYERKFSVEITSYDGKLDGHAFRRDDPPKYFYYRPKDRRKVGPLVDIHIKRDGDSWCLRQDLDYEVFDSDAIEMGELFC